MTTDTGVRDLTGEQSGVVAHAVATRTSSDLTRVVAATEQERGSPVAAPKKSHD